MPQSSSKRKGAPACAWGEGPTGPRLAEAEVGESRMHVPCFLSSEVTGHPPARLVLSSYF